MNRHSRKRTQAIARAQSGDPEVGLELLKLAHSEKIPAWRATLINHLGPWVEDSNVQSSLKEFLKDDSPLVRSAATNVMNNLPQPMTYLNPLKKDPPV